MTCSDTTGCLVVFTSWDIGIYVHFHCLLTRFCHHKFWNCSFLSDEAIFFLHPQKVKTKMWIYWEQKQLSRWNKKHFLSLWWAFHWSRWNSTRSQVCVCWIFIIPYTSTFTRLSYWYQQCSVHFALIINNEGAVGGGWLIYISVWMAGDRGRYYLIAFF